MLKKGQHNAIDKIDQRIISLLAKDGRMPITELAQQAGISKTPCQLRLKKLIDQQIIQGFRAVLNPTKLGLEQIAFVQVKLSDTREVALDKFNSALKEIDEIEECHLIAGPFDYLLKVRTQDIKRYRTVLGEKISTLPYVTSTSTFVVMQNVLDRSFTI